MGKLRNKILADMELRGLSITTQKACLREVCNFVKLYKKPPEQLGTKEVKEYLHQPKVAVLHKDE